MLVKIVDIHVDDAYYTWRGGLVGKEFNVTGPIYNCGDGWVGGELINL